MHAQTCNVKMEKDRVELHLIEAIDRNNDGEEIKELLENEKVKAEVEMFLEEMLRFLGEIPVNKNHDYRTFRHGGLRRHLINQFMREKFKSTINKKILNV